MINGANMTTNFNLRLDENLKAQSFSVVESFGMTPSQFMRLVLKQVADTGSLPLSFEKRDYNLSPNGERLLRESIADFENGNYTRCENLDDLNQAMAEIARG